MPDTMARKPTILTLIVATTPTRAAGSVAPLLGIGHNGTLPWPRIKSDMSFFARVTTRPPLQHQHQQHHDDDDNSKNEGRVNAIVMGRKTYSSLPKSLRPLKGRLNVVISRDESGRVAEEVARDLARQREKKINNNNNNNDNNNNNNNNVNVNVNSGKSEVEEDKRDAFTSRSLEAALDQLRLRHGLGHVFVIGGAEIYNSALGLSAQGGEDVTLRILMTRVRRTADNTDADDGFECDTFFPLTNADLSTSWREVAPEELEGWVGERVPGDGDWVEEGDVAIKIVGYERLV